MLIFIGGVQFVTHLPDERPLFLVSGRAVLLKSNTIEKAVKTYKTGSMHSVRKGMTIDFNQQNNYISFIKGNNHNSINVFWITDGNKEVEKSFVLNQLESVVINTTNDFELALVLKRKEDSRKLLIKDILCRIQEKGNIIQDASNKEGICLIGHSQIDNWDVTRINSYKTRNCGIKGISSFEYTEHILKHNILACSEDIYIIMHGTNDIVYDYSFKEILESIDNTVKYIRKKKNSSRIYFLQCLHVNGRLDRNNKYIDQLNDYVKTNLKDIYWISTNTLDDEFGNLKAEYTVDGLHLSKEGYDALLNIIEQEVV